MHFLVTDGNITQNTAAADDLEINFEFARSKQNMKKRILIPKKAVNWQSQCIIY